MMSCVSHVSWYPAYLKRDNDKHLDLFAICTIVNKICDGNHTAMLLHNLVKTKCVALEFNQIHMHFSSDLREDTLSKIDTDLTIRIVFRIT